MIFEDDFDDFFLVEIWLEGKGWENIQGKLSDKFRWGDGSFYDHKMIFHSARDTLCHMMYQLVSDA